MQRTAVFVDVLTVGRDVDERGLNAEGLEQFGRFGSCGTVGAIDENAQLAQIGWHTRRERLYIRVTKIGLAGKRGARNLQRGVVCRGRILQEGEDFFFDGE